MKPTADPAKTTVLLAAHGSSRPGGDNPVPALAAGLKARAVFADVCCGFLKETPLLHNVLCEIHTPRLVVVPMLTGNGYITDELIPDALKSVGGATTVRLCQPLGRHPAIARLLAERALSLIATAGLNRDTVSVLIAAHGNENNPQNARQAKDLSQRIETLTGGVPCTAAFIEEAPLISDWPNATTTAHLIVFPFLIGGGLHGAEDVPNMLGLDATLPAFGLLSEQAPFIGPLKAHGRSLWYCRTLGHEPALSDLIFNLASET